jgi:hypothetical protein
MQAQGIKDRPHLCRCLQECCNVVSAASPLHKSVHRCSIAARMMPVAWHKGLEEAQRTTVQQVFWRNVRLSEARVCKHFAHVSVITIA